MEPSALEKELISFLYNFRSWLRSHDRGVLIGVVISCIPIPPITLVGLLVGCANHYFQKNGKLGVYENRIIKIGLVIGIVNLVIGLGIVFLLFKSASSIEWTSLLSLAKEQISYFFDYVKSHLNILNFFQRSEHGHGETI
jgi:hypothetical protein